jgi:hypothetical protein
MFGEMDHATRVDDIFLGAVHRVARSALGAA